jgi:hypothetical protein
VGGDLPLNLPTDITRTAPPALPRYAQGGVVTKPTVAMIGEEGPEAVVPLTGGSSANLAQNDPQGPDIRMVAEAIHKATGLTGAALARLVEMWLMKQRMQQGQGQMEAA